MDKGDDPVVELSEDVMNQKVYASAVNSPSCPAKGLLISGYAFETMLRPLKEQNVRYILQVSPPAWEAATGTPALWAIKRPFQSGALVPTLALRWEESCVSLMANRSSICTSR